RDYSFARTPVVIKILHLIIRKLAEPHHQYHQVCRLKEVKPGDIRLKLGVDFSSLRIDREKYRAFESMVFGHDPRQHRQSFFRTIFLVTADKDDVFTLGTSTSIVGYPLNTFLR